MNLFHLKSKKILFLLPLIFLTNSAYADETEIQMDWIIEGQINDQSITTKESKIISNYEELVEEQNIQSAKPSYDKFVTNNH